MRILGPKHKDVSVTLLLSGVGDLRISGESLTGAGVVEPLTGFLYCNGVSLLRASYKALFDIIGTTYGSVDGTHFNLPDFRGRFLAGYTDGAASRITGLVMGGVMGAEAIALGKTEVPVHVHGKGALAFAAGGSHAHAAASSSGSKNTAASNDNAFWAEFSQVTAKSVDGGTIQNATHDHPSGEWAGSTADGSTAGESSLAAASHQNVHSHQAIGGILVAY